VSLGEKFTVSKDCGAYIFSIKESMKNKDPENKDTTVL
jgi:hypothetical protein